MKDGGEDFRCAVALNSQPLIKHWVRNIVPGSRSCGLPTSTDRFDPDFVVELTNGRTLVLEYKGAHLAANGGTIEKTNIGARLEETSDGQVVFWMADGADRSDFGTRLSAELASN